MTRSEAMSGREGVCDECGRDYPVWCALPHEVWNDTVRAAAEPEKCRYERMSWLGVYEQWPSLFVASPAKEES